MGYTSWGFDRAFGPLLAVAFGICFNNHKICTSSEDSRKYSGINETVHSLNGALLNPLLQQLVTIAFFRYFKVKLQSDCPFWPDDEGDPQGTVDRTLDNKAFRGRIVIDNPWTNDDETDKGDMTYVNLLLNPERYIRDTGSSPGRGYGMLYIQKIVQNARLKKSARRSKFYTI